MNENEKQAIEKMRKDLIEIFDEEYEKRRLITPQNTADKMTAKGYRKQEWIRVDERLPEEDVRVLVYINSERSYTKIDTDRMVDDEWVRWNKDITHWMPLPEPPLKGGEE